MAHNATSTQAIKDLVISAQDIFVLFPPSTHADLIAASLTLAQALTDTGKKVTLATPQLPKQMPSGLVHQDIVTTSIGNQNLIISLAVDERDSIDKVSYNLDEASKVFNLIIQPKKGSAPLDSKSVTFAYAGALADVIFVVGAQSLNDLGHFYQEEKELFKNPVVSLTRQAPSNYAQHSLVSGPQSSLSQLTAKLCLDLELTFTSDAASNALLGIDAATNRLTSPAATAETFELVATLMRSGGNRSSTQTTPKQTQKTTGSWNQISNQVPVAVSPHAPTRA